MMLGHQGMWGGVWCLHRQPGVSLKPSLCTALGLWLWLWLDKRCYCAYMGGDTRVGVLL